MAVMVVFLSCRTSKTCTGDMIQRRRDYDKREPSRDAHKIYIVCEGKGTEPNYFAFFEGLSSNLQVITILPEEGKTDPLKLMERANQILIGEDREYTVEYEHGDTVWFVVDTDTWEKEGKIEPLRQFCSQKNGAISLEYDEVAKHASFKEYVNSTIAGGFNFEKDPVRLETAIVNAERNFQTDKESKLLDYSSEVFMLGKEIDGFVKSDIAKLVNKLK